MPITDDTFRTLLSAVILFTSPWCSGCKNVAAHLTELAPTHPGISFCTMDISTSPATAVALGIMSVPTVVFVANGDISARLIGEAKRRDIERELAKIIC